VVGLLPGTPDVRPAKGSVVPPGFTLDSAPATTAQRTELLVPFLTRQTRGEAQRQSTASRLNEALELAQASTLIVKVTR
ncbi:hypothetical protein, partial [Streptococcus pneumoniae]|uniref:hypothetical protein n=1 Tax=Streptococcus pneumoniae TaxID=1313 RepID=UPI001E500B80